MPSEPLKVWDAPDYKHPNDKLQEVPMTTTQWLRELGWMLNRAPRDSEGLVWMTDALAKCIATSAIRRSEVPE